nr:RNA-directed DNA polymerase, eukaryota, reverse transcriptase zinc-binding domain protein [Tanacetum cinerariifolium]
PSRGYRRKKVTGRRGRRRKVTGRRGRRKKVTGGGGRRRKVTGGGGCRRKIGSRGGRWRKRSPEKFCWIGRRKKAAVCFTSEKESEDDGMKGKESVMDESEIRQESNIKEAGTKGIEVVIFDEEIVSEESKKWKLTVLMWDLNVSLNVDDHSEGTSSMTQDMEEFKECINDSKMEDICRSGLHYTWIKSLLNLNSNILKKIDRVMGIEEFLKEYFRAHAVFLPYVIFVHSLTVLTCPQTIKSKSRSFRFANYIADKDDFLGVIKDNWKTDVEGFSMFKLAKKLKALKPAMKKLNWKNRNLFENVKNLKKDLDEVQTRIDADPNNSLLKEQGVGLFKEYSLALED